MPRPRLPQHPKLLGASILGDHAWSETAKALRITKRELQIVQGVFDNLPEGGIAQRLKISEHTAHTHLNRLFKKLTVTTRTELVLRIMEQMITLTLSETGVLPPICRRHHTGRCLFHNPPAPPAKPQNATSIASIPSASPIGQTADYSNPHHLSKFQPVWDRQPKSTAVDPHVNFLTHGKTRT